MKKWIFCICSLLMSLAMFAGCGGTVVNQTPNDKKTITVKYYQSGYGTTFMDKIAKRFNQRAQNGEYNFYVQVVPDSNISMTFATLLEQSVTATDIVLPDMAIVPEFSFDINGQKGRLEDLTPVWEAEVESAVSPTGKMKVKDKVKFPVIEERYNNNGKYWGVPIYGSSTGLLYNKALFEEYKLNVPDTMAEMWDLVDDIAGLQRNTDGSKNNDIYSFIYPSMATEYWKYMEQPFWMQLLGEDAFYSFYNLDNIEENVVNYENYYKVVFENLATFGESVTSSSSHTLTLAAFGQQKAMMTPCGDWSWLEIGNIMDSEDIGFMQAPLICDLNTKKVIAKATPSSEVFAGVDKTNAEAVAEAEAKYVKVERAEVDPSVIPQEDAAADYIYFRRVNFSNIGNVNAVVPKAAKNKTEAIEFIKYLVTDEALEYFSGYAGSWMPYQYEFGADKVAEYKLSSFVSICLDIGNNSVSIVGNYPNKAVKYGIMNHMAGAPADYYVKLLTGGITPDLLYNTIKAGVQKALETVENDIKLYEQANNLS